MTINFGAFFAGKSNPDDPAAGTGYDNVSEKALISFYKDGKLVYSTVVEGTNSGEFTFDTGDVILEGFDRVVISAVDNTENSDFTIQGIDFITKRDNPIIVNEGKVTAESGADGFADAYADSHAKFDLAGMVDKNGGTLNEDGTSGTIMVLMDGSEQKVTLELSEGLSGESILTGTMEDGEQLFTATLDENGSWTMEQYEQFRVPGEGEQSSNHFELVFKTEDADGDVASTTVNVPLEVVDQTPATDTSIGNGDDTITITGGEGIAGTVAAGDSGGVEVQTTVQPGQDYNISIMLDLSGSMADPLHSDTNTSRIEMAVDALKNFFETSLQNHDGDISLQLVGFGTDVLGTRTWTIDGDDRLFGGTGDDVLLGMGGDDYIDGGAGEDAIFGGRGNDIIVYDNNDYLVSGGSGIDFMVSDDSNLTLETLLKGGTDDNEGPIVNSIEVLLKGNDALSLTSIQELADKYGITLGTNPDGQETLTLDMSKWTENDSSTDDTHVFTSKDSQLTLETNLQHDSDASSDNGEMAQQVFILEHTNS